MKQADTCCIITQTHHKVGYRTRPYQQKENNIIQT